MPIRFVYFDLGNVIFTFSHDLATTQMAEVAGVLTELVQTVVFDDGLQTKYETGLVNSQQFCDQFCDATSASVSIDSLLHANSDIFEPNEEIFPVIEGLKRSGIPIGILSNTCDAHWNFILKNHPDAMRHFPLAILSYEVNSMKPDGVIYQRAIELAQENVEGIRPGEIFFMDDRQENVDGAIAAGIDAVLFRNAAELTRDLKSRGVVI